jgi:phosphatidylserine/phosphatidylglycerophosphate/cardiolipin synthase-like enzyme
MKIIHGQQLVQELRKLSYSVTKRLWVAVPYIGSPTSVRRILGKEWFDSPTVSVKLLIDTSDLSCIDTETLQHFHDRGQVKTLTGLHAKIYIVDDTCLVTSANLTNTAFSKRHEIGILCTPNHAQQVIETFNDWWKQSVNVKPDQLNKIFTTKSGSKEEKEFPY